MQHRRTMNVTGVPLVGQATAPGVAVNMIGY